MIHFFGHLTCCYGFVSDVVRCPSSINILSITIWPIWTKFVIYHLKVKEIVNFMTFHPKGRWCVSICSTLYSIWLLLYLLRRSQIRVTYTQVTLKACGPLVIIWNQWFIKHQILNKSQTASREMFASVLFLSLLPPSLVNKFKIGQMESRIYILF